MSNNYYSDASRCLSCENKNSYSDLQNLTNYCCDQECLCRFTGERSVKDQMYYNWFVLDKPVNLPQNNQLVPIPKNKYCK